MQRTCIQWNLWVSHICSAFIDVFGNLGTAIKLKNRNIGILSPYKFVKQVNKTHLPVHVYTPSATTLNRMVDR